MKVLRGEGIAEEVVKQGPRRAVLVVWMRSKSHTGAIIGHALDQSDTDIGTNRHAGMPKRGKQRALRHDASSARLQTLFGPLKDSRPPILDE